MAYDVITIENVNKIKYMLTETALSRKIEISMPNMQLQLNVDSVSVTEKNQEYKENYGLDMEKTYFMCEESVEVLKIKNRSYEVFYNLGSWGYEARIPKSHLVVGTNPIKFGSDYFCQIELSQALEDNDNIYIVKNISKLAGQGAISRLNNGLGKDKDEKYRRRDELVRRLNKNIIKYNDWDWICVDIINKTDLNNEECYEDIFYNLMNNILFYALTIEDLIASN